MSDDTTTIRSIPGSVPDDKSSGYGATTLRVVPPPSPLKRAARRTESGR